MQKLWNEISTTTDEEKTSLQVIICIDNKIHVMIKRTIISLMADIECDF